MTIKIDLSGHASTSARAVLWFHSGFEFGNGRKATCYVRLREAFLAQRIAIHSSCAGSFDVVDVKVGSCRVLADSTQFPAAHFAVAYELWPTPETHGPHRAVIPDDDFFRLGLPISGFCQADDYVEITVRHLAGTPPAILEAIVLGGVI